jgi:hypothetical protein
MSAAPSIAGLAAQSAPARGRCDKPVPARIAEILAVVSVLTTYGRHLAETLEHRAVSRGFATIARFFGTAAFDTILAHVTRGLMRALALERVLLRRAASGRDLRIPAPRAPSRRQEPAEDAADSGQAAGSASSVVLTAEPGAAAPAAAPEASARPARDVGGSGPLTLRNLPLMEEIEAQVRRSPVGRTLAAICRDLGISPSLCEGGFWNRLFDAVRLYRGNVGKLVLEVKRREQRFGREEWRHRELELPEESREGIRRVLGFFIGEPPVDPLAVAAAPMAAVAAAATGPP